MYCVAHCFRLEAHVVYLQSVRYVQAAYCSSSGSYILPRYLSVYLIAFVHSSVSPCVSRSVWKRDIHLKGDCCLDRSRVQLSLH